MKKILSKILFFWDEDKSLSVMFLLQLLLIFVLVPILQTDGTGQVFIRIMYSAMLFTGIFSVAMNKRTVVIVGILASLDLIVTWLSAIKSTQLTEIMSGCGSILFNSIFAIAILVKTFKPGDITFQRIQGSIVVFLSMGLVFAYVFQVIYLVEGTSAFNNVNAPDIRSFLYYSFTTLTTVGYGDISPVHPIARSLANLEALIGQLYPAILIARLVSMEFESSNRKRQQNK